MISSLVLSALLMTGCSKSAEKEADIDNRQELLTAWGDNLILLTYQDLIDRSDTLKGAAQNYCQAPSQIGLDEMKNAWWAAREPLKKMEILLFGPYKDQPLRIGPKIDSWPVRTSSIQEVLYGSTPLTIDDFRNYGSFTKGFPVVEYLIYTETLSGTPDDRGSRACDYVIAASDDVHYRAQLLHGAWHPDDGNYMGELIHAGTDGFSAFESVEAALAEVVNRLAHTTENIRADKLLKPLSLDSGEAQQTKAESQFSQRSIEDIRDNLKGIKYFFYGSKEGETMGLSDLLKRNGIDRDDEFNQAWNDAYVGLDGIDPLQDAVVNKRSEVEAMVETLGTLQSLIQVEILSDLSLWQTFNDGDGD